MRGLLQAVRRCLQRGALGESQPLNSLKEAQGVFQWPRRLDAVQGSGPWRQRPRSGDRGFASFLQFPARPGRRDLDPDRVMYGLLAANVGGWVLWRTNPAFMRCVGRCGPPVRTLNVVGWPTGEHRELLRTPMPLTWLHLLSSHTPQQECDGVHSTPEAREGLDPADPQLQPQGHLAPGLQRPGTLWLWAGESSRNACVPSVLARSPADGCLLS